MSEPDTNPDTGKDEKRIGRELTDKTLRKVIRAGKKPLRKCQSLHDCFCCGGDIRLGELYRDGGYNNRIHEECYEIMSAMYGPRLAKLAKDTRSSHD